MELLGRAMVRHLGPRLEHVRRSLLYLAESTLNEEILHGLVVADYLSGDHAKHALDPPDVLAEVADVLEPHIQEAKEQDQDPKDKYQCSDN